MAELTTVADDEAVIHDGAAVRRYEGLAPDTEHDIEGFAFRTLPRLGERLATVGRFASQLAHDLKNPLAALKGAAQFLKEEHLRGRQTDRLGEFLDLILEQAARVQTVADQYLTILLDGISAPKE